MNIIHELFYGNINPNGKLLRENENYQKAMCEIDANEELLTQLLEGKEKRLFLDILNAYSIILGESTVAHFEMGFKLGARFATESTNSDIDVCLKALS